MLELVQIPVLSDNYAFLLHDQDTGETISVDSPDANAISTELERRGWHLRAIWNTHHHWDHAGGNAALQARWNCEIIAPAGDAGFIKSADYWVNDGDRLTFAGREAHVLHTPGHTMGHVCYYLPGEKLAFVGDTLFNMGCGRMFEGQPSDFWPSLQKLKALPPDTQIFCAHEYTLSNLAFALSVDAENADLQARGERVKEQRAQGEATVPFALADDLKTNPFLRADDPGLAASVGMSGKPAQDVFAKLRAAKDSF